MKNILVWIFVAVLCGSAGAQRVTFGNDPVAGRWQEQGVVSHRSKQQTATITREGIVFKLTMEASPGVLCVPNNPFIAVAGGDHDTRIDSNMNGDPSGLSPEGIAFSLEVKGAPLKSLSLSSVQTSFFTNGKERIRVGDSNASQLLICKQVGEDVAFNYDGSGGCVAMDSLEPLTRDNIGRWKLKISAPDTGIDGKDNAWCIRTISFDYELDGQPGLQTDPVSTKPQRPEPRRVKPVQDGAELYYAWAASYGVDGRSGTDHDGDGISSLSEYALGRNPNLNEGRTLLPRVESAEINGRLQQVYVYRRRRDAQARGLHYQAEMVYEGSGGQTTFSGHEIGVEPIDGEFELVSVLLPPGTSAQMRIRIKD